MDKNGIVSVQVRIPAGIHTYIQQEARRLGIAQMEYVLRDGSEYDEE